MTYSSFLAKHSQPLVPDTSVLINLYASTYGVQIIRALPNDVIVPETVAGELEKEADHAEEGHRFIRELVATGKVQIGKLDEEESKIFAALVSGEGSLDDGEAATIAIAATRQCLPIIDERRGRSRAQSYCDGMRPHWSLDLLLHPNVVAELGEAACKDAVYLALNSGRMRIDESHCDHVVGLIGVTRALTCNSLPGYKARRLAWQKLV